MGYRISETRPGKVRCGGDVSFFERGIRESNIFENRKFPKPLKLFLRLSRRRTSCRHRKHPASEVPRSAPDSRQHQCVYEQHNCGNHYWDCSPCRSDHCLSVCRSRPRTLTAFATLNTTNLRSESVAEPLRDLRVGLTLLEAASLKQGTDLLANRFEVERVAGLAQTRKSMWNLDLALKTTNSDDDVEKIVSVGSPLNTGARNFASNFARVVKKECYRCAT